MLISMSTLNLRGKVFFYAPEERSEEEPLAYATARIR